MPCCGVLGNSWIGPYPPLHHSILVPLPLDLHPSTTQSICLTLEHTYLFHQCFCICSCFLDLFSSVFTCMALLSHLVLSPNSTTSWKHSRMPYPGRAASLQLLYFTASCSLFLALNTFQMSKKFIFLLTWMGIHSQCPAQFLLSFNLNKYFWTFMNI